MNYTIHILIILLNAVNAVSGVMNGNATQAGMCAAVSGLLAGVMLAAWAWGIDPETARRRWDGEK